MDNLNTQLQKATKHIRLAEDEKALMREHLVLYMEHKPMRTHTPLVRDVSRAPSWSFFRGHHLTGALAIALIVTTTTFSVSSAASEALPGDLLYPVKVDINEEIKTAFITSDEARIAWERERAEMRLEEAGKLASEGRLDVQVQKEVTRRFAEHTESIVEQVRKVEETDPILAAEMSGDFEEALGTHEAVLARLIIEQDENVTDGARDLVGQVHAAASEAQSIREDAEAEVARAEEVATDTTEVLVVDEGGVSVETPDETRDDAPVAEEPVVSSKKTESANLHMRATYRAQERAQMELAHAEELVASLSDQSALKESAQAEIDSAKVRMQDGATALDGHGLGKAYTAYRNAIIKLQKVTQLVAVADLFDVEVYTSMLSQGDGEASSTATPSATALDRGGVNTQDALNLEETESAHAQAESAIHDARTLLLSSETESELAIKVNGMIKDASANMLRGEIYMKLGEYTDAQLLFAGAKEYAGRALALLNDGTTEHTVPEVPVTPAPTQDTLRDAIPESPQATERLEVRHTYIKGVHMYMTDLVVATSCTQASGTLRVAESYPEQIMLVITATSIATNSVPCLPVTGVRLVKATTTASAEAVFTGITLNGKEVPWVLVEGGASVTNDNTTDSLIQKDRSRFLPRTYETTQ